MRSLASAALTLACSAGLMLPGHALGPKPAPPPPRPQAVPARPEAEGDTTASPYFWVKGGSEAVDGLPLKSTTVRAEVAGVIADVKVVQVYRNTGRTPLEAVYVFPGSTRAAVHGLRMSIGERSITAQVQERGQARQTYEQAKSEGRTASLLEQHRPNVFQMNVANILPGDEVKVELAYSELLVPTEGTYRFVYPTVVGPRYAGAPGTGSHTGERWVASPYTHAGEAPLSTFDIQVKLAAGMPIARAACDSHATHVAWRNPGEALVSLDPSEAKGGNRDFVLDYQLAGGAVQSGLLLHRGEKENFFLLMVQPPKRVAPQDMPPREYVFVMDVSGSQMGFPLEVSKTLMAEMIRGLRPQDRFNVMVFEGSSALWAPASQPASEANLAQALAFVRAQNAGGGTELGAALRRALTLPRSEEGLSRSFVVSTDGFISADGQVFDLIRQHLGDANLFAFGIGSSVNRHLIEGMARAGQGEAFVVPDPAHAAAEAERFRAYVSTPALSQVRLQADGFEIYDVEPLQMPDVLAERPVVCFGKWKGDAKGTLTLSGRTGRGPWQQHTEVAKAEAGSANAALPQLWARARLQQLSDYAQFGETEARKREVTELGLAYHLLTAHTSFVAVDTQVRNAGGRATSVQQPLPLPEGVEDAAVGGSAYALQGVASSPAPVMYKSANRAALSVMGAGRAYAPEMDALKEEEAKPKAAQPAERRKDEPSGPIAALTSTRTDLPESALRADLGHRLQDPALRALLAARPRGTVLELRIGADGKVLAARFSRSFAHADEALARVKAWSFGWAQGKATKLWVTLAD